jgi:hypothetical protein
MEQTYVCDSAPDVCLGIPALSLSWNVGGGEGSPCLSRFLQVNSGMPWNMSQQQVPADLLIIIIPTCAQVLQFF